MSPSSFIDDLEAHVQGVVANRLERARLVGLDPETRQTVEQLACSIASAFFQPALRRLRAQTDGEAHERVLRSLFLSVPLPGDEQADVATR